MKVVAEYSQRFPRNVELLAYRLERSVAKGDVNAVAGLLADLPAEVESDNRFWRYRGWLRMTNGELAEAEGCFRKAIELNVYDYLSRHQLASVLRRSKRMEEVKVLEEVAVEGKDLHNELFRPVNQVPLDVSPHGAIREALRRYTGRRQAGIAAPREGRVSGEGRNEIRS